MIHRFSQSFVFVEKLQNLKTSKTRETRNLNENELSRNRTFFGAADFFFRGKVFGGNESFLFRNAFRVSSDLNFRLKCDRILWNLWLFICSTFRFDAALRPYGLVKSPPKGVRSQVRKIKVGNSGVLPKTKLEGDPDSLTFAFIQLFYLTQPLRVHQKPK